MELTPKQEMFVKEYLIDLNATQAAIRAGYSEKTARAIANENLTKPYIQEAIQKAMQQRSKRVQITADRVLEEYARIAFFDPRKLYNDDGTPVDLSQLDEDTARAVVSLDVYEEFTGFGENREQIGVTKKYKVADKVRALDSLAKHLGILTDKVEMSGAGGGPMQVIFDAGMRKADST